jgi:hypothetical protein
MKVKFSSSPLEAWVVNKLQFDLPVVGAPFQDADVSKIYVKYVDSVGATITKSGTISSDTVRFEGLDIYVAADSSQTVEVSMDAGAVTAGGAVTGDVFNVLFNGNPLAAPPGVFQATGASSATTVNTAVSVLSNPLRIAKSYPMVTANDNISTAMSANSELYSVTVKANSAGPIAVKQLCFAVTNVGTGSLGAASAKIFRSGESSDLVTSGEVTLTQYPVAGTECGVAAPGKQYVLVQWLAAGVGGEDTIGAGLEKTYILKGATAGLVAGDKVTTTLVGDNAAGGISAGVLANATAPYNVGLLATPEYFVWSDLSSSPHDADEVNAVPTVTTTDYLDGYLVNGLANVTAHEVKY